LKLVAVSFRCALGGAAALAARDRFLHLKSKKVAENSKMVRLSPEIRVNITNLTEQILDVIDEARKAEFLLIERFGENQTNIIALDELAEIAQQAADLYSQLSTLRIRIAEAQPTISSDMLKLLIERIAIIQNRIPALQRSTQEINLDWGI